MTRTDAAPALPPGYRVLRLDEVGSTNAVALERAEGGEPAGLWVVARRQVAGRGRQGRAWTSEPGNLYSSLLLRDPARPAHLGELPLVVAVAVHDAVADVLPPPARAPLQIKWPNDVLYGGAKICGILVEGAVHREGQVVVVGIGINCRHHPPEAAYATTDLTALGFPTDPPALFERLAARMAARFAEWQGGGFAAIRSAWLARARGVGEPIRVRLPNETLAGRFEALDDSGRLLLRLETGGLRTISAGDVFFGPAS
ncbi:biotin--[acetyl-CoA-carboxylase] ligase [Chthonobacter rhizosphaerae]|uniref:biotin--[acetyl-CoA-carboxylase] ligase n=1 Tax=Chthonobacter rhizosphaerae TaxID=2735553 RepID=UPI0015EEEA94|nr:biotin--[acetyl-CoA-carboxylase] ligase [Chthonobacter rhizosphaerae]